MFYNDTALEYVTEDLFIYENGKYCPIQNVTDIQCIINGRVSYKNNGSDYIAGSNEDLGVITHYGIFQKCSSLQTCPDIWNTSKYNLIKIKRCDVFKSDGTSHWYSNKRQIAYLYNNYWAFYEASDTIKAKISNNSIKQYWVNDYKCDWKKED